MFTLKYMLSSKPAELAVTAISRQRLWRAQIGAVVLATLFASCGHVAIPGGDANNSSPGGGAATPSLVITQSNSVPVVAEALVMAAGLGGAAILGAPSSAPDTEAEANHLRVIALQHMTAGPTSDPCAISGSVTTTSSNATDGTEVFDNCVDTADTSLTGTLTYTGLVDDMSTTEYHFAAAVVVDLTITNAMLTYTEVGDYTFDARSDTPVVLDISGMKLTFTIKAGAAPDEITLSSFDERFSPVPMATTNQGAVTVNQTVASSRMGGQFTMTTTATIKQLLVNQRFPFTGQILVVGAGNTRLQVTIAGDETFSPPPGQGQVELERDPGTGTFGPPTWTSWAVLLADTTPDANR